MFRLSNTPTVPNSDDEIPSDMDEPPDHVPELNTELRRQNTYSKSTLPPLYVRRESLLTKAFNPNSNATDMHTITSPAHGSRALSTASSQSVPSTAELTSDCELTSPARSVSPSPPPPSTRLAMPSPYKKPGVPLNKVIIAPVTQDDKPAVVDVGEAAVEKTLGRKRCIMFACGDQPSVSTETSAPAVTPAAVEPAPEPQPRKSRLTFMCPTRQDSTTSVTSVTKKSQEEHVAAQVQAAATSTARPAESIPTSHPATDLPIHQPAAKKSAPVHPFHEFGSSQDETDAWVDQQSETDLPKLTLEDVMKKENAIRRIAEEAEAEAEEEEREQAELDDELDEENDGEDDFAPSDDDSPSDAGNESDDEGGFADSDDESDAGSEYQFWAPATTTATTSFDNLTHFSSRQRSRSSSLSSTPSQSSARRTKIFNPRRASKAKAIRMRPGTPELPDSTDFVCGTLDEDRPLEAAYISCLEQKKRERHILIPQDIDPSFPTTDPDEEEDEVDDLEEEESEPVWLRDNFGAMDDDERGRRRPSAIKLSPSQVISRPQRPQLAAVKRVTRSPAPQRLRSPPPPRHRSPAPPKHRSPAPPRHRSPAPAKHRSPPTRRLFGQSPSRMRSPPPIGQLKSPRGSPTGPKMPLGITITRLAQRPSTHRTASLPQTPNPFFRNWKRGSPATSVIPSGAVTPGTDEAVRSDLHVRGPVDIVIGLEKKRQKRKEKYWRQHCRKAAREQSERKPVPGRGVERMKELGLECAERTRGYGLGQQANLVLSL